MGRSTLKAFSAEEFGLDSYVATVGANELSYTGNFTNRDDSARLGEIMVATLLTCGRADLATPETGAIYQRKLPGSRLGAFEHSSHWYFEEERALYLTTLRTFLGERDSRGLHAGVWHAASTPQSQRRWHVWTPYMRVKAALKAV